MFQQKTIVLNKDRNVTLTAFVQSCNGEFRNIPRRPAILICPGGGYSYCSDREAEPVAMAFLKAGYQVFILRYSVKEFAIWPYPLDDYEQAMSYLRNHADELELYPDKIAVIGFSAGGHLASCAATMSKNRPNAAILGYAVMGDEVKSCIHDAPNTIQAVDRKTVPCFVFATRNDGVVPVANSTDFVSALVKNGVSFESHIYAYGPHGFSTADSSLKYLNVPYCSRMPHWVEDSLAWLKDMFGDFDAGFMTDPACPWHVTGDYDDTLSIACTFGYLRQNADAMAVLQDLMEYLEENMLDVAKSIGPAAYGRTKENGMDGFFSITDGRSLEEVLRNTTLTQSEKDAIDQALRQISNE